MGAKEIVTCVLILVLAFAGGCDDLTQPSDNPTVDIFPEHSEYVENESDATKPGHATQTLDLSHVLGFKYIPDDLQLVAVRSPTGERQLIAFDLNRTPGVLRAELKVGDYRYVELKDPGSKRKEAWATKLDRILFCTSPGPIENGEMRHLGSLALPTRAIIVEGTLYNERGEVLPNNSVVAIQRLNDDHDSAAFFGFTDSWGNFRITGWPRQKGSFILQCVRPKRFGEVAFESGACDVALRTEAASSIRGRIADYGSFIRSGAPSSIRIQILAKGTVLARYVPIERDGRFDIDGLRAGVYDIRILLRGSSVMDIKRIEIGRGENAVPGALQAVVLQPFLEVL